jgi:hypothetical protein
MPKRKARKKYPRCGVVKFEVIEDGFWDDFEIQAYMHGETVGEANLRVVQFPRLGKALVVSLADVYEPSCGVGTRLYERMYRLACDNNARLVSDATRSRYSEGFWRKQVRKKRAHCISRRRHATRIHSDTGRESLWSCHRYAMKKKCPRRFNLTGPRADRRRPRHRRPA